MNLRQYKSKYLICKDDYGKNIYAGDTVELYCPFEMSSTWSSIVYWSMLHGAWVDAHPGHKMLSRNPNEKRELAPLLGQLEYDIYHYGEEEPSKMKGYCKKIKSFYAR